MLYNTRHMVARRQLNHGVLLIENGETFVCSPVDADYYVRKGWAEEGAAPSEPVTPEQIATEDAPKRRGRPPRALTISQDAPESGQDE